LSKRYKKANIYAVDISEQMLKQARKQTSRWFSKQQVIRADAVQLPFADRSIDLLLSNLMLQWCNPLDEVFTELVRVLKPKGMILFSTLGPDTLKELRHSWAQVDDAIHVNHFVDMHEIGDTLLRVGFSDPVMDVDWLTINYHDVFTLMSALKNVGAHNVTIGRSRNLTGKGKLKAMIAAYEHYRSPEGFLPATYEVIYGYALGKKENVSRSQSIDTAKIPISEIRQKYK
jgi:malonyl-CoA O-methyltransferase